MSNEQYVFGIHAVEALLRLQPLSMTHLYVQQERQDKKIDLMIKQAAQYHLPITFISKRELDQISHQANHQGVLAFKKKTSAYTEEDLKKILSSDVPSLFLILDGVQDPHNLGACFRSADAFGVHVIIAPKDKSVGLTPAVSKVASGAAESVPFIQVTNLVRTMEFLKERGVWLYGAAAEAEKSIFEIDFYGSVAIILGAEGKGLRRLTKEHCDLLMKIPMQGSVASLNVSVATGICLYEVVRQRFINVSIASA